VGQKLAVFHKYRVKGVGNREQNAWKEVKSEKGKNGIWEKVKKWRSGAAGSMDGGTKALW
jgi:hypothetical protein